MRGSLRILSCLVAVIATGCASDVGDIDRTQPNIVNKSIFAPEKLPDGTSREKVWYFRPTVTDVPHSAGFAFVGLQGETEKVVWDVQENMLVAYRAYEFTKGSEAFAVRPENKYRGAPVAAFPISKHFDVQRGYNPATGEQSNVLEENASDRPWHAREYMRVDWGDNRIVDFRFATAEVRQQALYYVQPTDADAKDRPTVSDDYIDISVKIFAEPETVTFQGYGTFPRCYLWSNVTQDCMGQAIKVRYSFMRAHDDREEYEPLPYSEKAQAKFGYFKTNRYVYDRERDLLESRTEQYAERFNLWLKSRRLVGTDEAGNDKFISIPYAERALRPIVWYVNDQFPRETRGDDIDVLEGAQAVMDDWDRVFRKTVQELTAKEPNRLVYFCRNNPVTDDDTNIEPPPSAEDFAQFVDGEGNSSLPYPNETRLQNQLCGPGPKKLVSGQVLPGLNPQIGDLRYNFQYWVPNPQASSPLGYGPHAADPETGRVVSANAFIYGAAMETYASYTADLISLMNDDLSVEDVADASYLRSLLKERGNAEPEVTRTANDFKQDIKARKIDAISRELIGKAKSGQLSHDYLRANMEALRHGWAANFLVTDEIVKAFGNGLEIGQPIPQDMKDQLNPSTWGHPSFLKYAEERVTRLSSNNITAADFYDDAIYARALRMKAQYACKAGDEELPAGGPGALETCKRNRFKKIRQDLMMELYIAVQLHEVGHTVGLRHNFAASTDALNYITEGQPHLHYSSRAKTSTNYWEARQKVQDLPANEYPFVPTFFLPYKKEEMAKYPVKELQYSSIMDYGAKPNGDFFGLGKYDQAAIHFGYGQLVEVFDPAVAGHKGFQLPADLDEQLKTGERHYTALPFVFTGSGSGAPADVKKAIDLMVKGRRLMPYAELQAQRAKDKSKAPHEVPYRFCSDEYVGGQSTCYRFDEGPDMYEMTRNVQDMYESLYWFNNFKRGRVNFALGGSMSGYTGRIYSRYFDVLSNQYKHMVNDELIVRQRRNAQCPDDMAPNSPMVPHYYSPLCGLDQYASAVDSLNFFSKVLSRPDVGTYGYNWRTNTYQQDHDSTLGANPNDPEDPDADLPGVNPKDEIKLELGQARYSQSSYDKEKYGYSFFYKPVVAGSWWDKYLAVIALGDPYTDFIGVDTNSDMLNYLINFNSLFTAEVNNMVGALSIEDHKTYAPRIDATGKLHYLKPGRLFTDNTDYASMKVLDPSEQYTVRLISAYLGVAYFSGDRSDTSFTNSMKISVAGMGESPSVPQEIKEDPTKYVEIYDPNSHKTYFATRYDYYNRDNEVDESVLPLGFQLMTQIKEKANNGSDIRQELHFVDIIRGILHDYEYVRGY